MPVGPRLTGTAPVRGCAPAERWGATKQEATRRDRPAIASTTLVAAAASAYGPVGHSAVTRASSRRRDGSSTNRVSASPATVASAHAITVWAGGTPSTDSDTSRGDPLTASA